MTDSTPPASIAELDELHVQMRAKARAGNWSAFGELLARRDRLLVAVNDADRARALTSALRCNEAVLDHARADRDATATRIGELGQKRAIDRYYRRNGGSATEL